MRRAVTEGLRRGGTEFERTALDGGMLRPAVSITPVPGHPAQTGSRLSSVFIGKVALDWYGPSRLQVMGQSTTIFTSVE